MEKSRSLFALLIGLSIFGALADSAHAQSSPNLRYGQVPTAIQWNSYFAAKQDYPSIASPGGAAGQCQYNATGTLGGVTGCTSNGTIMTLTNPALISPDLSGTITLTGITGSTQCLQVNTSGVVSGTGAICGAAVGTVTTTGSPASGNLTKFSGAATITNGDISGDCITSGTLVITCTKTAGAAFVASATTDTTNAANISSGNLALARITSALTAPGPIGSVTPGTGAFTTLAASSTFTSNVTGGGVQCLQASNTGVVSGTGSACGSGSGSVTTTGSPASGNLTKFSGASSITNGDLSGDCTTSGTLVVTCGSFVTTNTAQTISGSKRGTVQVLTLSTATATPNFDTGNNFTLTLSSACPCTVANPSTTPVAGQTGVIVIIQDGTGSRTIGTWGSSYTAAGGTATLALSTPASSRDYFSYFVDDSTHIVVSSGALNATH